MSKEEVIAITKVIYSIVDDATGQLRNDISNNDICPNVCMNDPLNPTPRDCAFGNFTGLRGKLDTITNLEAIAIVCGDNFGFSACTPEAQTALLSYNLTIIAKSINYAFFNSCNNTLKQRLIQCPTISADNVNVDDEIEIQTDKLIQKRRIHNYNTTPVTSSESSEGDEEAPEE